jgi:hypothetical protein
MTALFLISSQARKGSAFEWEADLPVAKIPAAAPGTLKILRALA